MTHALGVYYAPEHGFQEDRNYIAALQPSVIRILDPDVQHIADMHALAPNAIIAPRTWAIDDGSDEDHPEKQVRRLMADPTGTGRDHAQQYRGQWDRWQQEASQRSLRLPPVERILFNSANEPNQGGSADKIAAYSVAFLDRCTELGIRACAPCLGVGWPDNTGPGTPVDWTPYANAGLEQAIKRNGGMLSVHEYFYKTGPQDGWRWLAGRHLQCSFDVPIVLGEIGIDNYVYNERWQAEPEATRGNRGWQGNVSPDVYAEMIEYHLRNSDRRVVAGLIFITDFRNNAWESFNTRSAHQALLARKDRMVPQAAPPTKPDTPPVKPIDTHLPSIGSGAIGYVSAPAGLKLRSAPSTDSAELARAPYGTQIRIVGVSDVKGWVKVRYGDQEGFMYSQYISVQEPKPLPVPEPTLPPPPQPAPSGIIEPRVAQAILRVESGERTVGADGRPIIRFEAHVFRQYLGNDALWAQHFRSDPVRPWLSQEWRSHPDQPWTNLHTGRQGDEYAAFALAQQLDPQAAYQSISMGAAQIMGFHANRIGYPSAEAMFKAFYDPLVQIIGFINFCLSDPALIDAMRRKDFREVARRFNGSGQVELYAGLMERTYRELGGA